MSRGRLPTGTLTFLFTDIEGSTELWNRDVTAMSTALAAHDALLRRVVESHGGRVFKHTGDGVGAVFTTARAAIEAAVEAGAGLELAVRVGVDTGEAELRAGDYFGSTPNRAARVMDAGHGGQILVSEATAALALAPELDLIDLGEHQLRGFDAPTRLYQVGAGDFGDLRTRRHGVASLPVQLTSFVGRDDDVRTVVVALDEHRLVTLVGIGGVGKTRLALAAAEAAAARFADGSRFVDLAPVSADEAVPTAFAAGLGFRSAAQGDVMTTVVARLHGMRLVVVVDNCEHVRAAAATAVEGIVRGCPGAVVLATSREPLMVSGEQLIPVAPVPVPDARSLFIERARSEAPDLEFDDVQLAATDELCVRLDGLPLAIELAASRVRTFSPVELAEHIDERFRLLVGGRSKNQRHETLRGALDWSYEMCDPTERLVFERLAIFRSAFNLQAAIAVAVDDDVSEADVIDAAARLIDRSMLQHVIGLGGSSRYRLLETVRAYGTERLQSSGRADATRERHARGIAAMMTRLALSTLGPIERQARDEVTALVPDCRAALEWFVEQRDWDGAVRVATFGVSNSRREEQDLIDLLVHAIDTSGERPIVLAELRSTEQELTLPSDEFNKLALDDIRAGWRPPVDRFSYPAHYYLENFGVSDREKNLVLREAFATSLGTFDAAPLPARAFAEWWVTRCLAMHGATEAARDRLAMLDELAERLRSPTARSYVSEAKGQLALVEGSWDVAAQWFTDALTSDPSAHGGMFEIVTAWHRLGALALSGQPILGEDLRAPWRWLAECNLLTHREFGACTSAIALTHLDQRELGQRFWWWAAQNTRGVLADEAARLPPDTTDFGAPPDEPIDLDHLVDDLIAFADRLP